MIPYYFCLSLLFISLLTGIFRWKVLESGSKALVILLLFSLVNEIICLWLIKSKISAGPAHHIFSYFEICLITLFFLHVVKAKNVKKWSILSAAVWFAIVILNIMLFQPLTRLNTNVLLLESFSIIAMSLLALYRILLSENQINILKYAPFLLVILQMILWSGSFFFWGVGTYLIAHGWEAQTLNYFHLYLNIIVYLGTATVFLLYPKLESS